jgi:uncharacterized protein (DUF305 family)
LDGISLPTDTRTNTGTATRADQADGMRNLSLTTESPGVAQGRHALVARSLIAGLAAAVLVMAGYTVGVSRSAPGQALVSSVDAGFLRDMVVHHSQAVTLAMIIVGRATVPTVREMAGEIAKTQQREAGTMLGWLQQWDQPASTTAPPMAWMTHPPATAAKADPPMPGMATRRDVARLAVARGRSADLQFCRLMLPHHLGGLHMINEIIARGSRHEVTALAEQMRTTQQREITQLSKLLNQLSETTTPNSS